LLPKDEEDVAGRAARNEPGCEGICKQIRFGAFLVFLQGVVDDELELRSHSGEGERASRGKISH